MPSSTQPQQRLGRDERRAAIIHAATATFAERGFRGASTAQLAEACGVTQPILYRHFPGKVELYLACLAHGWEGLHGAWERALADETDPRNWLPVLSTVGLPLIGSSPGAMLWIRSLAEQHDDARIHDHVRAQMLTLHEYVTGVIERAQAGAGIAAHVDPRAEAWQFLATGLLFAISHQLGDVLAEDFLPLLAVRYSQVAPTG